MDVFTWLPVTKDIKVNDSRSLEFNVYCYEELKVYSDRDIIICTKLDNLKLNK
jgi:hypothetical protein